MTQSNIAKFFISFLTEHGSEDMLEKWNEEENMMAFQAMLAKEVKSEAKRSSEKKIKDPNAPKKGKNSYIIFCSKKREEAKAALGKDAKPTEVSSKLGEMWSLLKASSNASDKKALKSYEDESAADKLRFEEEMKDYQPPSDDELANISQGKKKKKTSEKDPNAPKRGRSAYILFCAAKREEAKESLGDDAKGKEVMARLGQMWTELKEDESRASELAKYEKAATDDKARYEEEKIEYTGLFGALEPQAKSKKPKKGKKVETVSSDDEEAQEPQAKSKKPKKGKKVETVSSDDEEAQEPVKKTKSSPKKMTGYIYYCSYYREEFKTNNPEMKKSEVNKELTRQWNELSKEDKKEWSDSAAALE